MNPKNNSLKIAAIGDIHAHQAAQGLYRELFLRISGMADVLLLCGDLTYTGLPEEARLLAADVHDLRIPVLGVLGNHDYQNGKTEEIKNILNAANMVFLEDQTFELKGVGFAGTKGFAGGFDNHMLASFGEQVIKDFVAETINETLKLENDLRALNTKKTVVLLHYSPITATVRGESLEIYPFLGSSRLAETIDRFDVKAIFHGHAHHGHFEGRTAKGIPVYNCCFDLLKRKHPSQPFALLEV